MRLPVETVLRRGVVFLWTNYARLDDPALKGQTKSKFIVILSGSPLDDPLLYILTTSEKLKHEHHPCPQDLFRVAADRYEFFPADTLIRNSDGFMEAPSRTQNLQPCSSIKSAMPMHLTPWR